MLLPDVAALSTSLAKNPSPLSADPAPRCRDPARVRSKENSVGRREELIKLRSSLRMKLHDVAGTNTFEKALDVCVAQPDAPVRLRIADRRGLIGAVDAVPFSG